MGQSRDSRGMITNHYVIATINCTELDQYCNQFAGDY